jgi:UDP-glucose 4-epimerase
MRNLKILVTGGAGFIGSHLIPKLLKENCSVTVFDNLFSGKLENLDEIANNPNFTFSHGDIRSRDALRSALDGIDVVVHLAALIDVSASVFDPSQTNEVNVTGTLNVLQESAKAKVSKFVFASSTAVYGDVKQLPVRETAQLQPISPYAASKAAGENYLSAFNACYGLNTVVLRFFNVYGPRNGKSPYSGVITKFLRKASNSEPLTVEGDGQQTRDFVHVDDVAEALKLAVETKNVGGEAFNICTGKPTSVNQLAKIILDVAGKTLSINHALPRVGDIRHSYGDPAKAERKLGFKTKIALPAGIKMLTENP